ncbi:MAG: rod shape-determining protein MreC [Flavobacteriaceae bacterium]|nr:rod shape-determining protein MreC [Flavobacteriaceae bacterium]
MQQLFNFFIRNKTFLFYVLLLSIAIFFTIQSHSYHKSKFINSANFLTGGIYESVNNIEHYFHLKEENNALLEENNRLKSLIYNKRQALEIDTISMPKYTLTPALVTKNSYTAKQNYLTLNKGERDGVFEDQGVITSNGIVGIIDNTSNGYSRVISILNTTSQINAKLKKSNHIGILKWDGKSPFVAQLTDIQGLAKIKIGDTVTTSGNSNTFPKDILIGTLKDFKLSPTEDSYIINVQLSNDMTNLGHVHIIENLDIDELNSLESNE